MKENQNIIFFAFTKNIYLHTVSRQKAVKSIKINFYIEHAILFA